MDRARRAQCRARPPPPPATWPRRRPPTAPRTRRRSPANAWTCPVPCDHDLPVSNSQAMAQLARAVALEETAVGEDHPLGLPRDHTPDRLLGLSATQAQREPK